MDTGPNPDRSPEPVDPEPVLLFREPEPRGVVPWVRKTALPFLADFGSGMAAGARGMAAGARGMAARVRGWKPGRGGTSRREARLASGSPAASRPASRTASRSAAAPSTATRIASRSATPSPPAARMAPRVTSRSRAPRTSIAAWIAAGVSCLFWAAAGAVFWLPVLLRGVLRFSAHHLQAMLDDRVPVDAGRRLRSAVSFYARGFAGALDVARTPGANRSPTSSRPEAVRGRRLLREAGWAALAWYPVLLAAGVLWSPPELWDWIVSGPWPEVSRFVGEGIAAAVDEVARVAARAGAEGGAPP